MFEIMKSVQASIARLESGQAELVRGQAELRDLARNQRRDMAGIVVIMKSVVGDFEERVTDLVRRMDAEDHPA
jgi:hypothetical protein